VTVTSEQEFFVRVEETGELVGILEKAPNSVLFRLEPHTWFAYFAGMCGLAG